MGLGLDVMEFQDGVAEPSVNKGNGFAVAFQPPKFTGGILEIHILSVDIVGLIFGKAVIIGSEGVNNGVQFSVLG